MNKLISVKPLKWLKEIVSGGRLGFDTLSIRKRGKLPISYLIILPEHATESDLAKRFLESMRNALGPRKKRNMKLLGPEIIGNLIDINDYSDYIFYTEEDLNRWGSPGKELIGVCEKIKVDTVLDLNQEYAPTSAALTKKISAPMKIGFYSDEGEKIYNIMIRRKGEDLAESGFKEIFQILGIE